MPELGELRLGREINSSQKTTKFIWRQCLDCERQYWSRYIVRAKQVYSLRCRSCTHKHINAEIRAGIRPKHILTLEQHKHLSQSKKGVLNPNYGHYGK